MASEYNPADQVPRALQAQFAEAVHKKTQETVDKLQRTHTARPVFLVSARRRGKVDASPPPPQSNTKAELRALGPMPTRAQHCDVWGRTQYHVWVVRA